jgi:hypothetical protein
MAVFVRRRTLLPMANLYRGIPLGVGDMPGANFLNMFSGGNRERYLALILLIMFILLAAPFLGVFTGFRILLDLITSGIFLILLDTTRRTRVHFIVSLLLVIPMLAVIWLEYFLVIPPVLQLAGRLCGAFYFILVVAGLTRVIHGAQEVTREVLFAAILVYLLLTLIWAYLYASLETVSPGSFSFPEDPAREFLFQFLYFSIVTITTLGYGDIIPLSQQASALAMVEALTGQIYLVVVLAWLVGMHVSRKSKKQ